MVDRACAEGGMGQPHRGKVAAPLRRDGRKPSSFDSDPRSVSDLASRRSASLEALLHFEQEHSRCSSRCSSTGPEQRALSFLAARCGSGTRPRAWRLLDAGVNRRGSRTDLRDGRGARMPRKLCSCRRARGERGPGCTSTGPHARGLDPRRRRHGGGARSERGAERRRPVDEADRAIADLAGDRRRDGAVLRFHRRRTAGSASSFEKAERGISRGVQGILADRGAFRRRRPRARDRGAC
jgi:hypothetical protein